jgi:hypothetical protein
MSTVTQEVSQEPKLKTYILLPHTAPTAPIFIQTGKRSKIRIDKLPKDNTNLKYTFMDKTGKNRTIRLKLDSNTIWQDEQMQQGIPANARFTDAERKATEFINGVLVTMNPVVQKFLESCPHFEKFEGKCQTVKRPKFTVYDREEVVLNENKLFKDRLKAANKIDSLEVEEAKNLLIRLHGSFFKVPSTLAECQNLLVDYMDSSDEAVNEILKEENSVDDDLTVLIGRLLEADILSFTAIENQVAKKKAGKFVGIKALSSKDYTPEQREDMFKAFLLTENGKPLLEDLKKDLKKSETSKK